MDFCSDINFSGFLQQININNPHKGILVFHESKVLYINLKIHRILGVQCDFELPIPLLGLLPKETIRPAKPKDIEFS